MHIVTTHKCADFDALASTIAATMLYPGAIPVLPRRINPNVRAFLSIHKDLISIFTANDIDLLRVKRMIVVDTSDWKRLDRLDDLKKRDDVDITLWDHHADSPPAARIQAVWECREAMGATITLMARELKLVEERISPILATLFLAGIYEDTGNLSFPSTKAEDAHAAAYLLENRADLAIINSFLRPAYGEQQKDILFEMLRGVSTTWINGYKISFRKMAVKGHVDGLSVVVNMYREIVNVDAAFCVFFEKGKQKCMVIARSNTQGVNVGAIMRALGGGGHPAAGSVMLKDARPEAVIERLKDLIEGARLSSVTVADLMSFPVKTVPVDMPMEKVAQTLREAGCTGLPVMNEDRLVGIISRRDFKKIRKDTQLKAPVKAFMQTNVRTISPDKSPVQAARLMVKHDIGRLPVIQDDRLIGIITRSDGMTYFYDLLPD